MNVKTSNISESVNFYSKIEADALKCSRGNCFTCIRAAQQEITMFVLQTEIQLSFSFRTEINLAELETDKTHALALPLEDDAGTIHLLVTISGTMATQLPTNVANYKLSAKDREDIIRKYASFSICKHS